MRFHHSIPEFLLLLLPLLYASVNPQALLLVHVGFRYFDHEPAGNESFPEFLNLAKELGTKLWNCFYYLLTQA